MAIFDIDKNDLRPLSENELEELIARLAEADVAKLGHSPASVVRSGSVKARDEGIDIHVNVSAPSLNTGFLVKPNTIFQAKKGPMPKSKISNEMLKNGKLKPMLSQHAKNGGSYIIVSLTDDCSPPMKKDRLAAMRAAISGDANKHKIHLDFFDRSKLAQWLREHPSVMLWVKGKLGQGYSGWQPYGSWSNPPRGMKDTFILAPGITVHLPTERGQKVPIEDAIEPMRKLIRSSSKAIRITGLSGVGKTRTVQALFDETVGANALDRTIAVYADIGAEPDPSASAMLDRLIAKNRRAIIILDNCPACLHSSLASKVSSSSGDVSLITVEFDIRDDKPQTTEVIHLEADRPEIAEELLLRRFPSIGRGNARRIAEFANGNARVSLAIAERVQQGESLAQLSDADLFDRLFDQRKGRDGYLREQAEVLSLVYSFSVSSSDKAQNELEILGSIFGHSRVQLFSSVKTLVDRHIIQKRAHWRAILPHAVANRLAASALERIPVETLRETVEAPDRHRLLMSFAHRLGLMHDHPVAQKIIEAWLQPGGLLGQICKLDENESRILDYIGPVAPKVLLERITAEVTAPDFQGLGPLYDPSRTTILNLLQSIAYEPPAFSCCIRLLIRVADQEEEDNIHDDVRDKISRFFQPYFSGTHASLQQRLAILNECLDSEKEGRKSMGILLLSTALDGPPWTGAGLSGFGARPRDYGYRPNHEQLVEWRSAFVDVTERLAKSDDPSLRGRARQILAEKFRGLWHQKAMREKLVGAAKQINNHQPWVEGWKAVRSVICFDYAKRKDKEGLETLPKSLAKLDRELKLHDLVPNIQTIVLGKGHAYWVLGSDFDEFNASKYGEADERLFAMASKLGEDFAASHHQLDELGPNLFASGLMQCRNSFGRGLAKGAHNLRLGWADLIGWLDQSSGPREDFSVIGGFMDEVASSDPELFRELLGKCAAHPKLRQILVGLHPKKDFSESDLDRCMALLDGDETPPQMFGPILWKDDYAHLPSERLIDLAKRVLTKSNGSDVLLEALTMKLFGKDTSQDTLGLEFRKLGLQAAIQIFREDHSDPGGGQGYRMKEVICAALSFDGNESEKEQWLNTIFSIVDEQNGKIYSFEEAIETTARLMPDDFLNRVFQGDAEQQACRSYFIRHREEEQEQFPLFSVDPSDLIDWCQRRNQANVWGVIAYGILLWERGSENNISITPLAVRFLESAPDPELVLQSFADRVTSLSWSVRSANAMQSRADALKKLTQHERVDVANEAKLVLKMLKEVIKKERECEKRESEECEQHFE